SSGTITLNVSNTFAGPLSATRKVYYRFATTNSPWTLATGTGPWTASLNGLSNGPHIIMAFATNGLEAPNTNTELAQVPLTSNVATYGFTVTSPTGAPAISVSAASIDFG